MKVSNTRNFIKMFEQDWEMENRDTQWNLNDNVTIIQLWTNMEKRRECTLYNNYGLTSIKQKHFQVNMPDQLNTKIT